MLAAIAAFEPEVNGDAFLHVLRAEAHLHAGDFAQARVWAERATAMEPGLDRGWWTAISACVGQKDFDATAKALTAAEKALGTPMGDLTQIPAYGEFVKSSQYQEWARSRK